MGIVHHNVPMATKCLFVVVSDGIVPSACWPRYPNDDHDLPFLAIIDAIGYMILWPWESNNFTHLRMYNHFLLYSPLYFPSNI